MIYHMYYSFTELHLDVNEIHFKFICKGYIYEFKNIFIDYIIKWYDESFTIFHFWLNVLHKLAEHHVKLFRKQTAIAHTMR